MKSAEDFDDFMKSKFSNENDFPFEEDKWARMEEMIIQDEIKRKRRKYFGFYLGGFISALLLLIPFYFMRPTERTVQKSRDKITVNTQTIQNQTTTTKYTQRDSTVHSNPIDNKLTSKTVDSEKDKKIATNSKRIHEITPIVSRKQKWRENPHSFQTPAKSSSKDSKQNDASSSTRQEKNSEPQNSSFKEDNKEVKSSGKITNAENSYAALNENSKVNDSVKVEVKDTAIVTPTAPSEQAQKTSTQDEPVKTLSPVSKHSFLFRLGAIYNFGYAANDGQSFSPYVGLTYMFKNKLAVGLAYFQVNQLNSEKEFVQRSYDFGYRDNVTTIKQKNIHYLSVPIEYHYSFGKNKINAGFSPVFLILNKSEIRENERTNLTESAESTKKSYRYAYGLSPLDIQLSLGYSRSISNKISIGVNFNYGLIDVRKNDWTTINKMENNKFITLMLIYRLK